MSSHRTVLSATRQTGPWNPTRSLNWTRNGHAPAPRPLLILIGR